jgi:hypothetical protein
MRNSVSHRLNHAPAHVPQSWIDAQNAHVVPFFIILLAISTKQEHLPISNSDTQLRPNKIRFRRNAEIYDLKHVIFAIKYGKNGKNSHAKSA